jgi:hypothetical protein
VLIPLSASVCSSAELSNHLSTSPSSSPSLFFSFLSLFSFLDIALLLVIMKFAIIAAVLALSVEGLNLVRRDNPESSVVNMAINRNPSAKRLRRRSPSIPKRDIAPTQNSAKFASDLNKRSSTIQLSLDNEQFLYFANISVGTPAQEQRVHIDTGSSDLWLESASSRICKQGGCTDSGTYDSNSSSTYKYVNSDFDIQYADGTGASGDYVTDTISIGGSDVTGLEMGIGYTSSSSQAVMGIGYPSNEAILSVRGASAYNNLPLQMVSQGLIEAPAYSLWLNDLDATTGQILFGGVDLDKFSGSLVTLPIETVQGSSTPTEFIIALTGVKLTSGDESATVANDTTIPVVLDSGSTLVLLPDNVATSLINFVNAQYDESSGAAYVSCQLATSPATIDFEFSGITISIGMDEMVISEDDSSNPTDERGDELCLFGVSYSVDGNYVLGDTFLRSAYVVYDLSANTISLAKTNFNATDSNIQVIASGTAGIPDATGVSNPATATPTVSYNGVNGAPTGATATDSSTSTATSTGAGATASAASIKPSAGNNLSAASTRPLALTSVIISIFLAFLLF